MASKKRVRKSERPARAEPAGTRTYELGVELTIRNAADQKAGLAGLLRSTGPVTVGAGALERVDTAGLQLLAAVVMAAKSAGREFRWESPAPVLRDSAAALGLAEVLGFKA
jgi:anti-anti-sigma regulatory factor